MNACPASRARSSQGKKIATSTSTQTSHKLGACPVYDSLAFARSLCTIQTATAAALQRSQPKRRSIPYITSNTYLKRGRNRMCMWSNLWSLSSNQAVQAEPPSKATQDRHLGLLADPCSTELHTNICSRKICHCNNVLAAVAASQVPLPHGLASPPASFRSEAKTIKKGKHFSSCSTGAQLLNNP